MATAARTRPCGPGRHRAGGERVAEQGREAELREVERPGQRRVGGLGRVADRREPQRHRDGRREPASVRTALAAGTSAGRPRTPRHQQPSERVRQRVVPAGERGSQGDDDQPHRDGLERPHGRKRRAARSPTGQLCPGPQPGVASGAPGEDDEPGTHEDHGEGDPDASSRRRTRPRPGPPGRRRPGWPGRPRPGRCRRRRRSVPRRGRTPRPATGWPSAATSSTGTSRSWTSPSPVNSGPEQRAGRGEQEPGGHAADQPPAHHPGGDLPGAGDVAGAEVAPGDRLRGDRDGVERERQEGPDRHRELVGRQVHRLVPRPGGADASRRTSSPAARRAA